MVGRTRFRLPGPCFPATGPGEELSDDGEGVERRREPEGLGRLHREVPDGWTTGGSGGIASSVQRSIGKSAEGRGVTSRRIRLYVGSRLHRRPL